MQSRDRATDKVREYCDAQRRRVILDCQQVVTFDIMPSVGRRTRALAPRSSRRFRRPWSVRYGKEWLRLSSKKRSMSEIQAVCLSRKEIARRTWNVVVVDCWQHIENARKLAIVTSSDSSFTNTHVACLHPPDLVPA